MADGLYYVDTKLPHLSADVASVTLSTTNKALVPAMSLPVLGSNYFSFVGKAMRISMFGRMTTGATPGNGTFSLMWGTGADANGTSLVASAATALTASQTNLSWWAQLYVRCRALGSSGTLMATGILKFNEALVVAELLLPASAPAAVSVDLTQNFVLSPQFLRSGSTSETMQVHEFFCEALN